MSINTGEPAFPCDEPDLNKGHWDGKYEIHKHHPGMSLRDWFAGQALASRGMYGANVREKEVAEECYQIADAMLAEREKGAK